MRVSGFTILRDGVRLGYPFEESIRSLLPLVDELVIAVGDSTDGTWDAVCAIRDPKIRAFQTRWDLSAPGGQMLSQQTNLALQRCTGTWAMYLQADEVLHEDDLGELHSALRMHACRRTEALAFRYLHFFGSHRYVLNDWRQRWPWAFRAVKLGVGVRSVGDAAGFRICRYGRMRGLIGASSGARIFHYGWCRDPATMAVKQQNLRALYLRPGEPAPAIHPDEVFSQPPGRLEVFTGTHPGVMSQRVAAENWKFEYGKHGAPQRAGVLRGRNPRRLLRYFLPFGAKNAYWRSLDLWRSFVPLSERRA